MGFFSRLYASERIYKKISLSVAFTFFISTQDQEDQEDQEDPETALELPEDSEDTEMEELE